MNMPCSSCHRLFSGVYAFDRHYLRREDRCKTDGELGKAGLTTDMHGVWDLRGFVNVPERITLPPGTVIFPLNHTVGIEALKKALRDESP